MSNDRDDEEFHQDLADQLRLWFWCCIALIFVGVLATAFWMFGGGND